MKNVHSKLRAGMLYKHFKGKDIYEKNIYYIEAVGVSGKSIDTTTITYSGDGILEEAEDLVVYSNIYNGKIFVREYSDLIAELSEERQKQYNQKYRLEPLTREEKEIVYYPNIREKKVDIPHKNKQERIRLYYKNDKYFLITTNYTKQIKESELVRIDRYLNYPVKIEFINIPEKQMMNITDALLYDKTINAKWGRITHELTTVVLSKKITKSTKRVFEGYKVINVEMLSGREKAFNPFLKVISNGKKALIETKLEDVDLEFGDYYIEANDLTISERLYFDDEYSSLKYDEIRRDTNSLKRKK